MLVPNLPVSTPISCSICTHRLHIGNEDRQVGGFMAEGVAHAGAEDAHGVVEQPGSAIARVFHSLDEAAPFKQEIAFEDRELVVKGQGKGQGTGNLFPNRVVRTRGTSNAVRSLRQFFTTRFRQQRKEYKTKQKEAA